MLSIAHRTTQINQTLLNNKWIIIKGTMCSTGKIQERELYKHAKYTELRVEIKKVSKYLLPANKRNHKRK